MQNCTRVQVDFPAYKAKLYERAKGNFPVGLESPRYILIGRLEHIAEEGTITLTSEQLQDTCFIMSPFIAYD